MNREDREECAGGCLTITAFILIAIFMFHYKCSTKQVVRDATIVAKEYVTIIDSVWNEK